ncbi:AraC family transcriptional regulator ligand-binding domain-containing protein [Micromonospora sp. MS34]|uniref:AraC family transcriptional regulator n=1 Tax=Micromonospora sp. MS34 TaxID=3385971 RepID=UPI00399EF55B
MTTAKFTISPSTAALLADLDLPVGQVLRMAGLPEDLFLNPQVSLTPEQFYALWTALEQASGDPALAVSIARRTSSETFQPPIFAGMCSPDLRRAAERIALHKRLLGPLRLVVDGGPDELRLTVEWPRQPPPPPGLVAYELLFWVALARLGTRTHVRPLRLSTPQPPEGAAATRYREYLGVPVRRGAAATVTFSGLDARRPFLTANAEMWQVFEPELRRRLADLDRVESTADRVRAALLELLPAGQGSTGGVARRLALGARTLQRRLAEEGTSFQAVLEETRRALARHYLGRPEMSIAEIAFLLGYDEPSSFYRAFHQWTGSTPQQARSRAAAT